MASPGEHHPAFEEYCECIYELLEENVEVIQARIVERLQVSRPSVSEMMKRMEAEDLVALSGSNIALTETGEKLALRTVRRHRIAERFLTDILGLSWAHAHHEAGRWEHVMSAEVETAMDRVLGNPTTCPHGNPIPGSRYLATLVMRLVDVAPGRGFTVDRIPEELEFTPGLLEFLETAEIHPGKSGMVSATSPDGSVTVEIDGQRIGIGPFASARILVTAQ